jgi:hypothetical protein|tara:strand:- start:671 stop:904 length:234 start_codon:yes stop_codon:yes gene_type:complete
MWTLFLIITLNANPSDPTIVLQEKSIMGGISSHEIGFFRNEEDCRTESIALIEMSNDLGPSDYVVNYTCFPTRSEPE